MKTHLHAGLTEPVRTYDQMRLQFAHLKQVVWDTALHSTGTNWTARLRRLYMPPAYAPGRDVRRSWLWWRMVDTECYAPKVGL